MAPELHASAPPEPDSRRSHLNGTFVNTFSNASHLRRGRRIQDCRTILVMHPVLEGQTCTEGYPVFFMYAVMRNFLISHSTVSPAEARFGTPWLRQAAALQGRYTAKPHWCAAWAWAPAGRRARHFLEPIFRAVRKCGSDSRPRSRRRGRLRRKYRGRSRW